MFLSCTRRLGSVCRVRMMSTNAPSLVVNQNKAVVTVELNRPKVLNALSKEMCDELIVVLNERINAANSGVAAFVVKGTGGKAFCAGGDVKSIWSELTQEGIERGTGKPGFLHTDFFRNEYTMNFLLGTSRAPQVSLWDGVVMGGGVGISVLGKFRVATEKTLFAMPETAIGLFPDVGSSAWLPHLPNGCGLAIGLTGMRLGAADLLHAKIATHYCKSEKLPELEATLAAELSAANSPAATEEKISAILASFQAASGQPDTAKSVLIKNANLIGKCFGDDKETLEDVIVALQVEMVNESVWAEETLQTLGRMSPSSLHLTLAQIRRGAALDLAGCLKMEYRMIQRCMKYADFQEGIRALLIDKDQNPKWKPSELHDVTPALVDSYFESLGEHELRL